MSFNIRFDSICGVMHREKGISNQDAVAFRSNDRIGVTVLADGAGSRRYAQQGAETAVKTVSDYLFEQLSDRSESSMSFIKAYIDRNIHVDILIKLKINERI